VSATRIRVWDLPIRIFHWVLAALAVFSFATGHIGGHWLEWHMRSGFAILALLGFRVAWGIFGSETSRFASFVRGPSAFLAHARDVAKRTPRRVIGHNPMGAWMVIFMIAILAAQAVSGLFADDEISHTGPLVEKVSNATVARMSAFHSVNGWIIAAAVVLHVVAIAFYWVRFRDNLVASMWNGWRDIDAGVPPPAMRATWVAAIFLAIAAAAVYWLVAVYPRS
jgi:cytochrome b